MTTTTRKRGTPKAKSAPPLWEIGEILGRLEPEYGPPKPPRGYDPVSELVYTILSQHTSDTNSIRAYESLTAAFSSWEAVAAADVEAVADAIRGGGLARVKAPRIQTILREVKSRAGKYDLSFLAAMPLEEAKAWLRELPGVGPKTAGCVLMFALDMPALPVDTHVYRVAKRLGLFGEKVNADQSHDALEAQIEPRRPDALPHAHDSARAGDLQGDAPPLRGVRVGGAVPGERAEAAGEEAETRKWISGCGSASSTSRGTRASSWRASCAATPPSNWRR